MLIRGRILSAIVAYTLVALSGAAHGQTTAAFCSPKDAALYFGNGIWTTRDSAKANLEHLQNQLVSNLPPEVFEKIEFGLAYNTSNGRIQDLLESFIQDVSTDATLFWRALASLVPMPDAMEQKLYDIAASIDKSALLQNQDLATHVGYYKAKILEGKRVIVTAHSQGNFFANQSFGNLTDVEKNSFEIVSVANPDTTVASGGPYTTLIEDLVIGAIILAKQRAGLPGPLLPNVTNVGSNRDLTGHSFVHAYLVSDSNSKSQIINDVSESLSLLPLPPYAAGEGIITVTLTWGAQPDVDLHAFEPNDTHVYYANRIGPSGYLDVDDVTSYGPEHYFVGCDSLEAGTYRLGVNYYHGYAPEVANVQIEAGVIARGYSIFLPSALGSAGNASPQPVATIVVTGSEQEGYEFAIQ